MSRRRRLTVNMGFITCNIRQTIHVTSKGKLAIANLQSSVTSSGCSERQKLRLLTCHLIITSIAQDLLCDIAQ
jgi:hypothetical protein